MAQERAKGWRHTRALIWAHRTSSVPKGPKVAKLSSENSAVPSAGSSSVGRVKSDYQKGQN